MNSKLFGLILILICIIATGLRLYGFNQPIADWHSWRQVDTAAVARNFVTLGIDVFHPRYDDLSNIQSGKDNLQGYRMVEFPLYQLVSVGVYKLGFGLSIEQSLRLVSIFSVVGTIILLSLFIRNLIDSFTGLLTGLLYGILPYSVYYGRTTLPEPFMVFWAVLGIYSIQKHFQLNIKKKQLVSIWWIISMISCAIALLVKPVAMFLLLPIAVVFISRFQFKKHWLVITVLFFIGVCFPLWWWRSWMLQYPEGIPSYGWLLNEGGIRFKGAWFYWLFAKRISELILGYWGIGFLILGIGLSRDKQEGWLLRTMLLGSILYFIIVARGNVQHDYYQILILPTLTIYVAKGISWLLKTPLMYFPTRVILTFGIVFFMLSFSWYNIRTYFWINRQDIVTAGKVADAIIPKNAKVIAPYNGDTTFLYQINRQGWPIGFDIQKKITLGATHYVTVSPTDADLETRDLATKYTVIIRNESFAIIDLTKMK